MSEVKKPSEQVLNNSYDGKEIVDSLGRKLRLRKPNILDKYDLMSALGDEKSPHCLMYAFATIQIVSIDGMVIQSPKSSREVRATLQLIRDEGVEALNDYLGTLAENTLDEKGQIEKVKK